MSVHATWVDNFLPGSYTIYNYDPVSQQPYYLYPQIVGYQKIGQNYYNEMEGGHVYMINYTVRGQGTFITDSGEKTIETGDLIISHTYFHHILKPIKGSPWEFYFIHVQENYLLSNAYQAIVSKGGDDIRGFPSEKVVPTIEKIAKLLSEKKHAATAEISLLIYKLFLDIASEVEHSSTQKLNPVVESTLSYIKENFEQPITSKDIINRTNYSKNHLERLFKAYTGTTIQNYIMFLRLQRSENLLLTSSLSFKEIAERVGLSEYRSLYHLFKKAFGVSPKEYRAKAGTYVPAIIDQDDK